MSFIYPQFLFGLLSVGIPILIHLLNLQKPKKTFFSNTLFLKNVQNLSKKSIKLKNILILLTRVSFVTFLVLAFAQPQIDDIRDADEIAHYNIYIDNSQSMQSNVGKENALDLAIRNASALSENLSNTALINIYTNDLSDYRLRGIKKANMREALSQLDYSTQSSSLKKIANFSTASARNDYDRKKAVYIFSDFQKSTLGNLDNLKLHPQTKYFIVPITPEESSNIYVDSVWIPNPYIDVNVNNSLNVRLVNSGKENKENITVQLEIEGKLVSTSSINIKANSNEVLSANFSINTAGLKKGKISLTDYPVTFDNEFYFSFKTLDKINILDLSEGDNSSPFVKEVYSDSSIFYYVQKSVQNIDYSTLSGYNLVILNNLKSIEAGLNNALFEYVQKEGVVIVIPSGLSDVASYNSFFNKASIFLNDLRKADSASYVGELKQPDYSNPFYHGVFQETKDRILMPTERAYVAWNNIGVSHLSFKNGSNFLTQANVKKGKIFLFASNLKQAGGLAYHALFVPIMFKIAFISNSSEEPLAYHFDDKFISVQISGAAKNDIFKMVLDSLELIPDQRISGKELALQIQAEANVPPGHFKLSLKDSTITYISLNYPEKESLMSFYSAEDLKRFFSGNKNVTVLENGASDHFQEEIKLGGPGYPLWKVCLICALFFLLLEILLLRFYKFYENPVKVS